MNPPLWYLLLFPLLQQELGKVQRLLVIRTAILSLFLLLFTNRIPFDIPTISYILLLLILLLPCAEMVVEEDELRMIRNRRIFIHFQLSSSTESVLVPPPVLLPPLFYFSIYLFPFHHPLNIFQVFSRRNATTAHLLACGECENSLNTAFQSFSFPPSSSLAIVLLCI